MGLRLNTGLLSLQRNLQSTDRSFQNTILQLATALRLNSAADGPAALAISEQLRAGIAGQNALVNNTTRAANLVQTAEGALTEVSNQLIELRGLAVEAANTGVNSPEATQAIQAQIQNGIEAIQRISDTTLFGARSLLNGSFTDEQFQISEGSPVTLTIPDTGSDQLGTGVTNTSNFASLAEIDVTTAQGATDALAIIDAAIDEVTSTRADLGAFQANVLESNVRSIRVARQNLLLSESTLRDANFAEVATRTALLQTLLQTGVTVQGLVLDHQGGLFLNLLA